MERSALYTALRMNWLLDPSIEVEEWQVADYRGMSLEELFQRLDALDIALDLEEFHDLGQEFETPEELTESLAEELDAADSDKLHLLVFELWRRLLPEKLSLSIFCDELDHQIFLYEQGLTQHEEEMQDILANLEMLLDDHTDEGLEPIQVFDSIADGCVNDIENFLYDFIATKINEGNESYASELIEAFSDYVPNPKWLEFFEARLLTKTDPADANAIINRLAADAEDEHDIEFNFGLLTYLIRHGDQQLFRRLVGVTLPLLEVEEDFKELLSLSAEHYHLLDKEAEEEAILKLIAKRKSIDPEKEAKPTDPDFSALSSIMGLN